MNELELIKEFRADLPGPSAAATAHARRAWEQPGQEPRRSRGPRLTPRIAIAGAVAAAAICAALMLPADKDGDIGAGQAQAAETLRLAAGAQHGGLDRPLRPGEFWYVKRRTAYATSAGDDYTFIQPQVREDWVAADGTRRWRTAPVGPPRFPTEQDRKRWEQRGRLLAGQGKVSEFTHRPRPGAVPFRLADEPMTYGKLLALPRDPATLYRRFHDAAVECECGNSVDQETFVLVGDFLRDAPLPTDLRAAVLRAAALIPGIRLIPDERDLAGRMGVGVGFDSDGRRNVLVFDRQTHELLGEHERLIEDRGFAPAGFVISGSADIESGVVDSITARPAPRG